MFVVGGMACVRLHVCMYVLYVLIRVCFRCFAWLYVCMFACYATHPRRFASRTPNYQGFIYDPGWSQLNFFENVLAITFYTNNQITLCSYCVQLPAMLCQQRRLNVERLLRTYKPFSCISLSILHFYFVKKKEEKKETFTVYEIKISVLKQAPREYKDDSVVM